MNDKQKEVFGVALDKLNEELQRGPMISADRVRALTNTIEVLTKTSLLEERVTALERQLTEQPNSVDTIIPLNAIDAERLAR